MIERQTPFSWRLVAVWSPLGLIFAMLTITGSLDVRATRWAALGLVAVVGIGVGWLAPGRPFRHGLAAGFVAAVVAVEIQGLFLSTYFANNPEYADIEIPLGLSPRLATMLLGPANAVVGGLIAGLLAWGVWKASGRGLSRPP